MQAVQTRAHATHLNNVEMESNDPVIPSGHLAVLSSEEDVTLSFAIGDGETPLTELPFFLSSATDSGSSY